MPRQARPTEALGKVLRAEREQRGDSQEGVAHRAGITTGTLARMELGQSDPAWSTVVAAADALGLKLRDLGARVEAER